MYDLEKDILAWSDALRGKGGMSDDDLRELEGHVRETVSDLGARGLAPDEAFMVAVKRVGNLKAIAGEFGKAREESLFRQFEFGDGNGGERDARARAEALTVAALAVASGLLCKLPYALGFRSFPVMFLNASFFALPGLVAFLFLRRKTPWFPAALCLAAGAAMAVIVNAYPYLPGGQTQTLSGISLPLLAWFLCSMPFAGSVPPGRDSLVDFVRISGETFLFGVLSMCGVLVLAMFADFLFGSLGMDVSGIVSGWILPCLGFGLPVLSLWLAVSKSSIVQNVAPVLAKVFIPLFVVLLAAFLAAFAAAGGGFDPTREMLIGFDLLLALALALIVYSLSAKQGREKPGFFDWSRLALVVLALASDGVALFAMAARIADSGATANKVAALGMNVVLSVDLAGLAAFLFAHAALGKPHALALRFQASFLWAIAAWLLVVCFAFPPLFAFG